MNSALPTGSSSHHLHRFVLGVFLFCAAQAWAASVAPAGYTNAFSVQPAAADWATFNAAGGGGDSYSVDSDVNANITAAGVTAQVAADSGNPPSANANAVWSSTGLYLQTRPTGNRYTALMGKFVNNTGTNATQIGVSYLFTIASGGASEDSGKGTRAYLSLSGAANTWANLGALNTTASDNGSVAMNASIPVGWTNGGTLFLLWVDDNGNSGTDAADQFDNFSLRITDGTPTNFFCRVTAPTNNAVLPSNISIATAALTGNGTAPYTVEYFTNSGAGNTVFASAGASAAAPYSGNLGTLSVGIYNIYAVSTDSAGSPLNVRSPTNTFSVVNPIAFTLTAPADGAMFEYTNPVSGTVTVSGGTSPYSVQFYLDGIANGAPITSSPFQQNFGALPVGDHTVRATVTDAKGWVSNSLVSTIHISGPLAAILTPVNGSVFPYDASLSLTAAIAGGESPYAADFFVNGQLAGSLASPPFTLNLGVLPKGSYTCYVHATDSSLPTQNASSTTNVIRILQAPLRVMPLGDSITYGLPVAGGYRAPLYQLITNSGRTLDFIGMQTANSAASLPDPDHEGYSGYSIRNIDSILPAMFSADAAPDVILILLGVNDYRINDDTDHATNRLEALVERLATNWPAAKIVVANLLVTSDPYNTQIQTTFNPLLPGLCERQRALGRQVYFNDLRSVISLSDLPDQLHPNQFGYNKMATNWWAAIQFVQSICSNCPPVFLTHPASQSVQPGASATLTANATGLGGPITYQWRLDGTNIQNATNAVYTFTNATLANMGNHSVAATDNNGTTISSNAFVNVLVRPGFVLNPLPQTVLQGGTATFTAIATGAPPIWYRWLSNGTGIVTNNTGVWVITNVQASYTVRLTATNYATGPAGQNMVPATGVALKMLPDFDHDGMADEWEAQFAQFGFSTNDAGDAALDFDNDRMLNRDEYVAGTNPTNASSVLKLALTVANPAVPKIEFIAQSNIAYTVQCRSNLISMPWSFLTNISAQSQVRTVQVNLPSPTLSSERFYRVVTPPVP
jgi:lysophospholipase L1-like esterase